MALKNLEFNETGDKKFKVSFSTSGKINVFLDRVDNSDVMIYLYPKGFDPVLYKVIKPEKTDVLIDMEIPGDGEITVDIVSNSEVINACYVTSSETFVYSVPASSVVFDDGDNFQAKLESGELKGDKGDKGDTGAAGAKGDKGDKGVPGVQGVKGDTGATGPQGPAGTNGTNGADGKSVTAISLTTDTDGKVTGGTCTLSDGSSVAITVTTTPAS